MIKEWVFTDDKSLCHFRVAGVLIRNNKIFLQKVKNDYMLPGGQVDYGETSENALVREFKEEIGVDISCERLLWVEENFWKWDDKNAHGISFYYLVSLRDNDDLSDDFAEVANDNKNVLLQWVSLDDVNDLTIYPQFAKDKIGNLSASVEHFVRRSWGE
jgi:8-oxo-dGTP pyrophosphatase MutT (NUDIX family)